MLHKHRHTVINKGTRILLFASTLWVFGDGMLGPLFAIFAEEVGGNILDITSVWATFLAVTGVGFIVVGKISDKVGKRRLMIAGYALSTLFTFGYLAVDSPADLFVIQIGLGLGLALAQPTWLALYDEYTDGEKNDGFLWGLTDGLGYLAAASAILFGGFIITHFSFQTLFIAMGCVMALSTVVQARIFSYGA